MKILLRIRMSANSASLANAGGGGAAANAADPKVLVMKSPVPLPRSPSASASASATNTGSSLMSWLSHPAEAFGAFKGMLSKKVPVEINEEFLESMKGIVELKNPSIDELLKKYSGNDEIIKYIARRKFAGVRARYQLINLISSMLHYLNEYKKTRSTPLLQISATEDLLDDLVLYLVYLYEKDMSSKELQDKIRSIGGRAMELRNTMSQDITPTFVDKLFGRPQLKYQIPPKFNETLNTFIDLNSERAKVWGVVKGSGVRESSGFPFLAGTDNDDLDLEGLDAVMDQYLQIARAIERRKIRDLGDMNYSMGSPTVNAEKLRSLQRRLDDLSDKPDFEAILHFGPSRSPANVSVSSSPLGTAPASVNTNAGLNRNGARNPISSLLNKNNSSKTNSAPGGAGFLGPRFPITPTPNLANTNNNAVSALLTLKKPKTQRKSRKAKSRKLKSRKQMQRKTRKN